MLLASTKKVYVCVQASANAEKQAYANNIIKLYPDKFPAIDAVNIRQALVAASHEAKAEALEEAILQIKMEEKAGVARALTDVTNGGVHNRQGKVPQSRLTRAVMLPT